MFKVCGVFSDIPFSIPEISDLCLFSLFLCRARVLFKMSAGDPGGRFPFRCQGACCGVWFQPAELKAFVGLFPSAHVGAT